MVVVPGMTEATSGDGEVYMNANAAPASGLVSGATSAWFRVQGLWIWFY